MRNNNHPTKKSFFKHGLIALCIIGITIMLIILGSYLV